MGEFPFHDQDFLASATNALQFAISSEGEFDVLIGGLPTHHPTRRVKHYPRAPAQGINEAYGSAQEVELLRPTCAIGTNESNAVYRVRRAGSWSCCRARL